MWFTHRGAHQCSSLNRILTSHYNATLAPTNTLHSMQSDIEKAYTKGDMHTVTFTYGVI